MGFAPPSLTGASQTSANAIDEPRIPGIDGTAIAPNAAGPSAANNALSLSADASRTQTALAAQIPAPLHGPNASPIDPSTDTTYSTGAPAASRNSPFAPDSVSRSEPHAAGGVHAYRAAFERSAGNADAAGLRQTPSPI